MASPVDDRYRRNDRRFLSAPELSRGRKGRMTMRGHPSLMLWLGIVIACLLDSGCSQGTQAYVSGSVTLDGSPLDDATITFVPISGGQRGAAWAPINAGKYS